MGTRLEFMVNHKLPVYFRYVTFSWLAGRFVLVVQWKNQDQ